MEILKVENLCKTYGEGESRVDALKNVSFSLEKGEFAAVIGESGSERVRFSTASEPWTLLHPERYS